MRGGGTRNKSKLVPYVRDIRRLRRGGKSYRAIAEWLRSRGVDISSTGVFRFWQRKAYRLIEPDTPKGKKSKPWETYEYQ